MNTILVDGSLSRMYSDGSYVCMSDLGDLISQCLNFIKLIHVSSSKLTWMMQRMGSESDHHWFCIETLNCVCNHCFSVHTYLIANHANLLQISQCANMQHHY